MSGTPGYIAKFITTGSVGNSPLFANGTNLQATADALYLHRNSLAYRLRRIEEVCGIDLDDIEDRFRLQLALKGRRMLS